MENSVLLTGKGWGHGIGMSQYGAYGAATKGKNWRQILAFYYPGTKITKLANTTLRIWLSVDGDANLTLRPTGGLRIAGGGKSFTLPTGAKFTQWRITWSGKSQRLQARASGGKWVTAKHPLPTASQWRVESPRTGAVPIILPSGNTVNYRGSAALVPYGSSARTVNTVDMDSYLRSVVPSEMPTSWAAEAVRAQAVAARTYVTYLKAQNGNHTYDSCDSTYCQVYRGAISETARGDAAVAATAKQIVTTRSGSPALTMYSSSNGGASTSGGPSYLKAQVDPYDQVKRNSSWEKSIKPATFSAKWPKIGTFTSFQITKRSGIGPWGGFVDQVKISGSKGSVTVTGNQVRNALGLKSTLFTAFGGWRAGSGISEFWKSEGGVTGWLGHPTGSVTRVLGGYFAPTSGADLYWSRRAGFQWVAGEIRAKYRELGGARYRVGFPTSNEYNWGESRRSNFVAGVFLWTPRYRTQVLVGDIAGTYQRLPKSNRLGALTTNEIDAAVPGSRKSLFTAGGLYWTRASGTFVVWGPTFPAYLKAGADSGRLGLPTGNAVRRGTTTVQRFQRGVITCTPTSCRVGQ